MKKYVVMEKYTRYLRNWAEDNDSAKSYGASPATFDEWQLLKEQGFQPEEDYVVIGGFGGTSLGVNNDDIVRIPHFHVVDEDGKDVACIALTKAIYIPHDDEEGKLDDDGKVDLMELLNSVIDYPKFRKAGITHWDFACLTWNFNNEQKIRGNAKMPDYKKLR
jgi:hypothetical protein